eukprot:TRINITY_DN60531_c0_g1_i1.p1 TRINITY_DN60531_c0_g1~~TRINITY_DN60531_c0_g1_i1.p1  ORF type:complete len:512 (-),score=114.39 TRINITY_DN60531_c0_g1_i1:188-1723(-)
MKVKVTIDVPSNLLSYGSELELTVGSVETVAKLKERVSSAQLLPFPEQVLRLSGRVLEDEERLSACGVQDGSALVLQVSISEASLGQQLSELLRVRSLSCDELGLLYCYKHGVSVAQVMKALGQKGKLQDFLFGDRRFSMEGSLVSLAQAQQRSSFSQPAGATTTRKHQQHQQQQEDCSAGKALERLSQILASDGFEKASQPLRTSSSSASSARTNAELASAENKKYVDLHNSVSSRAFNSKASQVFNEVVSVAQQALFLDVLSVVKAGALPKGTAIFTAERREADAEAVFIVRGLPPENHRKWLPPLLRASVGILQTSLQGLHGITEVRADEDSIRIVVPGIVRVQMRISPVFDSYNDVLQAARRQEPLDRGFYSSALVEQEAQFVSRQPGSIKMTIRLLKWWCDQQAWSGNHFRPSDEILELVAIHSAVKTKPGDQKTAIANVMALMSKFDELFIMWSNYYTKDQVEPQLLRHRPLVMGPANPFVNVADKQAFNSRELMAFAKSTAFFS